MNTVNNTEDTSSKGGTEPGSGTKMVSSEEAEDSLIEAASTPTLASLFQRGKDAGLIKPGVEYGSTS